VLGRGVRVICLLRDGPAVAGLAAYLQDIGQGDADLTIMECLGGPRQRIRTAKCGSVPAEIAAPVAVAIHAHAPGLPTAAALPDEAFAHDGQITKRPVRALTLSALAPRQGEVLWDIGAGSGSIGITWLLAGGGQVHAVEGDAPRAARAVDNATAFGLAHRYAMHHHTAPDGLANLPPADVVFIGGGANQAMLETVWRLVPPGTRLVANAVTLETEGLLSAWSAQHGGSILRIELAEATPLGAKRGWRAAYPVVQWSVTR
jgi:precorrin-6B C5,15-methyltransferase / cobalt-precorrin-6B C5,C15-methyltransferase